MCGLMCCGVTTTVIGAILVFGTAFLGYSIIPDVVENQIIEEVILLNDTEAIERFEDVPFALNFTVRLFNVTNPNSVAMGAMPILREVGPYIYRLRQRRLIEEFGEDHLVYRRLDVFEFNAEASYPNTEDDVLTIVNVPFHAVLNAVEEISPALMPTVNLGLNGIFGPNTGPLANIRVRDLLFDGIPLCENAVLVSAVACNVIRSMSSDLQNMELQPDNSLRFSLLAYRNGSLGERYNVSRGSEDIEDLGRISMYSGQTYLSYWPNLKDGELSNCNLINGTDSGIYNPFLDLNRPLYALNPDICRSVELRYQHDVEYEGLPGVKFAANEWMFGNDDGCFCLNVTQGLKREDGCMYRGAIELFSCVGAHLVLSYPHFLFADPEYVNGVIGVTPNPEIHRIFLDLEPNTGIVLRGAKRAQFNIFMRPLPGIPTTSNLRTTLTPIFWIEESILLPEEYVDRLSTTLISTLNLLQILIPVLVAVSCVVFVVGVVLIATSRLKRRPNQHSALSSAQPGKSSDK